MVDCPYLKKASCCASKWLCEGQVPTRRVTNLSMCRGDWMEICPVYRRAPE